MYCHGNEIEITLPYHFGIEIFFMGILPQVGDIFPRCLKLVNTMEILPYVIPRVKKKGRYLLIYSHVILKVKIELGQIGDLRHSQVNLANNLVTVCGQRKENIYISSLNSKTQVCVTNNSSDSL